MMFRGREIRQDHFIPCVHRSEKRKRRCCAIWDCKLHHCECIIGEHRNPVSARDCSECPDKRTAGQPEPVPEYTVSGQLAAITSLSPHPSRQARQQVCLQSWKDVGIRVVVINSRDEFKRLNWLGESVERIESDDTAGGYDRPVLRVNAIVNAGIETGGMFALLNSDIEIAGDVSPINRAMNSPDRLTIGVRQNHAVGAIKSTSIAETAGLDVFCMSPKLAETIPEMPLGIGKPGWDYWLPLHFRSIGVRFNWITQPLFFHEAHPRGWSVSDWDRGHDMIFEKYNQSIAGAFRQRLCEH